MLLLTAFQAARGPCAALATSRILGGVRRESARPIGEPKNAYERFMNKTFSKGLFKARYKYRGSLLYEGAADTIDYVHWFERLALVDAFAAWFVVTELHVWMLMVRCMNDKNNGALLRNFIVEALWNDAETRAKKLKSGSPMLVKKQLVEMGDQFRAAVVGYDEGLLAGDTVLAGAIWRRLFDMRDVDPALLEAVVRHIREQIHVLERIPESSFVNAQPIAWMKLTVK